MAGQGVNMGFSDVQCLVTILEQAVQNGADFGMNSIIFLLRFILEFVSRFFDLFGRL